MHFFCLCFCSEKSLPWRQVQQSRTWKSSLNLINTRNPRLRKRNIFFSKFDLLSTTLHVLTKIVTHSLSRNHILDTTDISMGSQLNLLPATVKEKLICKNMQEKTVDYVDSKLRHILLVRLDTVMVFFYQKSISDPSTKYSMIINPFSTLLTKKKDTSLKSKIKEVYTMQILNNRQRVQREVVRFMYVWI